jgi:hypothetical protein
MHFVSSNCGVIVKMKKKKTKAHLNSPLLREIFVAKVYLISSPKKNDRLLVRLSKVWWKGGVQINLVHA